jgi:hypothetical protein
MITIREERIEQHLNIAEACKQIFLFRKVLEIITFPEWISRLQPAYQNVGFILISAPKYL